MVTFTLTVDWSWTPAAIKRVKKTSHKKPSKSSASPAVSPRSIWSLSAALQWARLAESYLTISCSIHERAIMYKRVSKACERAPRFAWRAPAKLFCPRGMKDVEKKNVFLLEKQKKTESLIAPHTFPPHRPLSSSQYANEHVMFQLPDRPRFSCTVAILCRGGLRLVPGVLLWLVAAGSVVGAVWA